jgi:WD40 repeat protein
MQVLFAHCAHPVPDPREFVSEIPQACTTIIHKAMAKNRSERYRSAGELLGELEQVLAWNREKASTNAPPPAFIWSGTNTTESSTAPSLASAYPAERTRSGSRSRNRRPMRIGLGIACGLLTAILVVLILDGRGRPEPSVALVQPVVEADWPARAAEADRAIRSRNSQAMREAIEAIRIDQKREPLQQEAMRQTFLRLEKSLAFRESITDKGLVIGFDAQVSSVLFSLDGNWLAIGQIHGDAGAFIFDSHTGEKRRTLWPRRGTAVVRVHALAIDRDGTTLAALTPDNSVKLVHVETAKESSFDYGPGVRRALAVAFSPASRDLIVGLDAYGEGKGKPYLKAWNLDTGREPFRFKFEHSARVAAVGFTSGGRQVATGSNDKRVVIWNADTGRIWRELRTGLSISAVACSPNGRMLAVAGSDEAASVLQFWDYAGETLLATKPSAQGPCNCVAFSHDGGLLASGSGSQVHLWNPETQTRLTTLTGHSQIVTSVAFSEDGTILATSGADQTVRLWDITRHLPPRLKP